MRTAGIKTFYRLLAGSLLRSARMARRVGAIVGMVIVIALAIVLLWSVHLHHIGVPNADTVTTVSLDTRGL